MRKPFILCFLLALLPTYAYAQQAEETQYQIDLVLFLHTSKSYRTEENWPKNIDLSWPEQYTLLLNESEQAVNNDEQAAKINTKKTTDVNELIAADVSKLTRLPRYKVVDHLSFMTTINKEKSATEWGVDKTFYDKHGQKNRLAGTFKVYKSRFLHIKTNLWLAIEGKEQQEESVVEAKMENILETTTDIAAQDNIDEALTEETVLEWPTLPPQLIMPTSTETIAASEHKDEAFTSTELIGKLVQHRKLRSNEKHYIDHPLFGVLVYIKPVETEPAN